MDQEGGPCWPTHGSAYTDEISRRYRARKSRRAFGSDSPGGWNACWAAGHLRLILFDPFDSFCLIYI